jgi:hypothetical protein
MGKILRTGIKKVGKIGKGILKGAIDSIFPNIKNSFIEKEQAFLDEPVKYKLDFWRLFSAVTIWILLLMVFFGKIQFSDISNLLNSFIHEIFNQ